jgi:hypothetical protein
MEKNLIKDLGSSELLDRILLAGKTCQDLEAALAAERKVLNSLIQEKWKREREAISVKVIPQGLSGKSFRGKLLNEGIDEADFLAFVKEQKRKEERK